MSTRHSVRGAESCAGEKQPTVSTIVPCYNKGRFIARTLESIQQQTLQDWECIIVDDGSTDNSAEVCLAFAAQDRRFIYLRKSNGGVSKARDAGRERIRGSYVHFLDADDFIPPDLYAQYTIALISRPDVALVYADIVLVDEGGHERSRIKVPDELADPYHYLLEGNFMLMSVPMVRREALEGVGAMDSSTETCEDWDFWLRVAFRKPGRFVAVPGACIFHRRHPSSVSFDLPKFLKAGRSVLRKHRHAHGQCAVCRNGVRRGCRNLRHAAFSAIVAPRMYEMLGHGDLRGFVSTGLKSLSLDPVGALGLLGDLRHQKRALARRLGFGAITTRK